MAKTVNLGNGVSVKTQKNKRGPVKKAPAKPKTAAQKKASVAAKQARKSMTQKEWIAKRMKDEYYKALGHNATQAQARAAAQGWLERYKHRKAGGDSLKMATEKARSARKAERAGFSAERKALHETHKKALARVAKLKDPAKRKAQRAKLMADFKSKSLALAKASKQGSAAHKAVMAKIKASRPKRMRDYITDFKKIRVAPASYKFKKTDPQPEYSGTRKSRAVIAWEAVTGKKAKQTSGGKPFGGKGAVKGGSRPAGKPVTSKTAKSPAAKAPANKSMKGAAQPAWGGTRKSPELRQWQKDNPDKKPVVTHGKMAGSTGGPTSVRGKQTAASAPKTVTTKSGTKAKIPAQFQNAKPAVTPPQRKTKPQTPVTPPQRKAKTPPTTPTSGGQSRSGGAQSRGGREMMDMDV